jgi:hypothetical protein
MPWLRCALSTRGANKIPDPVHTVPKQLEIDWELEYPQFVSCKRATALYLSMDASLSQEMQHGTRLILPESRGPLSGNNGQV